MTGAGFITAERGRQVHTEGYTPEADTRYVEGELRDAAIAYLMVCDASAGENAADVWPWPPRSFKPGDELHNLVRAGALIAAEIDRLIKKAGS